MDLDELKEEKKRMKESLLAAMYKTKDSWNIGCSGKSEENDEDEDNESHESYLHLFVSLSIS